MKKAMHTTVKSQKLAKGTVFLLVLFLMTLLLAACGKSQKGIKLPDIDSIEKITLTYVVTKKESSQKVQIEKDEIAAFKEMLEKTTKKTGRDSVNDVPTNTAKYITVQCNITDTASNKKAAGKNDRDDDTADSMFIYQEDTGKALIEIPYVGIFELSEESYKTIEGLFKQ